MRRASRRAKERLRVPVWVQAGEGHPETELPREEIGVKVSGRRRHPDRAVWVPRTIWCCSLSRIWPGM